MAPAPRGVADQDDICLERVGDAGVELRGEVVRGIGMQPFDDQNVGVLAGLHARGDDIFKQIGGLVEATARQQHPAGIESGESVLKIWRLKAQERSLISWATGLAKPTSTPRRCRVLTIPRAIEVRATSC